MAAGRHGRYERSEFGARLTGTRQRFGLSQAQVAERLGVTQHNYASHAGGPFGKAQRLFEAVSRLPRCQQQRILGVVEDLLAAQRINGRRKESES